MTTGTHPPNADHPQDRRMRGFPYPALQDTS